jgi:hypothetical protein
VLDHGNTSGAIPDTRSTQPVVAAIRSLAISVYSGEYPHRSKALRSGNSRRILLVRPCAFDEGFDLRGITLAGKAELVPAPEALELNRSIHLRYVTTAGLSLAPVRRYLATDDVTIRVRPTKVSSWNLRDTEQGRALNATGEFRPLGGS